MRMNRTQICLDQTQLTRLRESASEQGVSIAELIRRLIDRYFGEKSPARSLESFAGTLEDSECQSTDLKKFLYPGV